MSERKEIVLLVSLSLRPEHDEQDWGIVGAVSRYLRPLTMRGVVTDVACKVPAFEEFPSATDRPAVRGLYYLCRATGVGWWWARNLWPRYGPASIRWDPTDTAWVRESMATLAAEARAVFRGSPTLLDCEPYGESSAKRWKGESVQIDELWRVRLALARATADSAAEVTAVTPEGSGRPDRMAWVWPALAEQTWSQKTYRLTRHLAGDEAPPGVEPPPGFPPWRATYQGLWATMQQDGKGLSIEEAWRRIDEAPQWARMFLYIGRDEMADVLKAFAES